MKAYSLCDHVQFDTVLWAKLITKIGNRVIDLMVVPCQVNHVPYLCLSTAISIYSDYWLHMILGGWWVCRRENCCFVLTQHPPHHQVKGKSCVADSTLTTYAATSRSQASSENEKSCVTCCGIVLAQVLASTWCVPWLVVLGREEETRSHTSQDIHSIPWSCCCWREVMSAAQIVFGTGKLVK